MREIKQIAYNRSNRNGKKIEYIVVHDTGNSSKGANAQVHYKYFNGGDRGSSADFFVDDKETICINDYHKYYTWHCGDGRGKYGITNSNSIGVEICINVDGDRQKAITNTVTLVKELMRELDIPVERVVRHYDASRKNCPNSMSGNDWFEWQCFKNSLLIEEEPIMHDIYNTIDDVPDFAKATIQKLCDKGFLKGDDSGLNLSYDMLRMLVIMDRTEVFD
jgi:N-acetylmuramoyl-L-alanine amidase CwlA